MQPEARLVKKIQALIRAEGGRPIKIHGGDPMQEQGLPDLVSCFMGRFVGLEVKQPGEKPSPKQRQILNEIEAAGGVARVVSTVEEVADLLAEVKEEVMYP